MRYPIVFWDSGGTIFHQADWPGGFAGSPSLADVKRGRAARVAHVLEMFGHVSPPGLPGMIEKLDADLYRSHGARYSLEILAAGLYEQLGLAHREETLMLADALAGPRYRAWLWEGVAEALAALQHAGVRMGLLANTILTGRMMRGALAGVGLADCFGPVVCSCDLGVGKPDRRIFEAALASLAPSAGPVLYVGDNIAKDIDGAAACGWDAALHLTTPEKPPSKAVLSFTDYKDLVRLVLA